MRWTFSREATVWGWAPRPAVPARAGVLKDPRENLKVHRILRCTLTQALVLGTRDGDREWGPAATSYVSALCGCCCLTIGFGRARRLLCPRMHAALLLAALLAAPPSPASFADLKKGAVLLERPAQAIAVLVGACDGGDGTVSGECLDNTKELKDKVTGKRVALDLGAGHDQLLSFASRTGNTARFVWAPLYDVGNGLALTVGRPQKINEGGSVVIGKRPLDGYSPDDFTDLDLRRLCATGQVGIQLVGSFAKPWTMSGGGKTVRGVPLQVEALRLYHARTGATLFESTTPLR